MLRGQHRSVEPIASGSEDLGAAEIINQQRLNAEVLASSILASTEQQTARLAKPGWAR
ncbi:hypothetical protein KZ779_30950 [Escherichia coli]|nr:hypothetical protein [Escherichia coli]